MTIRHLESQMESELSPDGAAPRKRTHRMCSGALPAHSALLSKTSFIPAARLLFAQLGLMRN